MFSKSSSCVGAADMAVEHLLQGADGEKCAQLCSKPAFTGLPTSLYRLTNQPLQAYLA